MWRQQPQQVQLDAGALERALENAGEHQARSHGSQIEIAIGIDARRCGGGALKDGGQLRDFVSIHDVVDCLMLMLEKPGADFLPVNIGSGETVTILQIAELIGKLLRTSIEPLVTQTGRKFDIRHNTADISRARETLGYSPRVPLDEGFAELIDWARTTPDVAEDFFDKALQELQDKGLLVRS